MYKISAIPKKNQKQPKNPNSIDAPGHAEDFN